MARWQDVHTFIHDKFQATDISDDLVKLVFNVDDGRSQLVFVGRESLMDGAEEWAMVASPFAPREGTDLDKAIELVSRMVCGGMSKIGDHLVLKHSFPLANMDNNELMRPLQLVVTSADRLERELVGTDAL